MLHILTPKQTTMTDLKTPWINDREYPEYVYDDDGDCVHEFRIKEIGEFVVHAVNTIAEQSNNPDSAPAITVGQLREIVATLDVVANGYEESAFDMALSDSFAAANAAGSASAYRNVIDKLKTYLP